MTRSNDPKKPGLEHGLQNHIGRQLRRYYDDMISEPVPDKFLSLLEQLDNAETAGTDDKKESKSAGDTPEAGR